MTSRHIQDFEADVLTILERDSAGQPVSGFPAESRGVLRKLIEQAAIQAVGQVHRLAPTHMLDGGNTFAENIFWDGHTFPPQDTQPQDEHTQDTQPTGFVALPEDFMRLVVFQMSDWERPVYVAGEEADPRFAKHSSRFKGVRGTPQRPVCAIGMRGESRVLEFRSCKSRQATIARAVYIPHPEIHAATQTIDICTLCIPPAVALAASKVQAVRGNIQQAQTLQEMALQLLK